MDQKNKLEVCGRNVDWKYNPWFKLIRNGSKMNETVVSPLGAPPF